MSYDSYDSMYGDDLSDYGFRSSRQIFDYDGSDFSEDFGSGIDDSLRVSDAAQHVATTKNTSLKQRVMALIKPYRHRNLKPPFSVEEMIIMAMVCKGRRRYTMREILRMILTTYRYYEHMALKDLLFKTLSCPDDGVHVNAFTFQSHVAGFKAAFENLQTHLEVAELNMARRFSPQSNRRYAFSVSAAAARMYLEQRLWIQRSGTFPFVKLPAELRNTIYEMVLRVRHPGLTIERGRLRQLQWPGNEVSSSSSVDISKSPKLSINPVTALLAVCKQIHKEASPVFFGENLFCFPDADHFNDLQGCLRPTTTQWIRKIYLALDFSTGFVQCLETLANLPKLTQLTLHTFDSYWTGMSAQERLRHFNRKTKFTKPKQIAGLRCLVQAAAKAEKFEIQGNCEDLRKYIEAEVAKVKSSDGTAKPTKRRRKKANATTAVDDVVGA